MVQIYLAPASDTPFNGEIAICKVSLAPASFYSIQGRSVGRMRSFLEPDLCEQQPS